MTYHELPQETVMVEFNAKRMWLVGEQPGCGGRALAPPEDADDEGNITVEAVRRALSAVGAWTRGDRALGGSFAHLYRNGVIKRYGKVIGTVKDLAVCRIRGTAEPRP